MIAPILRLPALRMTIYHLPQPFYHCPSPLVHELSSHVSVLVIQTNAFFLVERQNEYKISQVEYLTGGHGLIVGVLKR